ncbi:hypothetical protein OA39_02630 [Vibrio campbellii]|nr:hypothetical protein OA39_02630 [Vibrio campbellii]CAD7807885.1 hypothetical protein ACOMICROBIO_LMKGKHOH_02349 [Vibrio sp. B1FIG11]CAE6905444.1 hypothetical protein ACOMICROBIO_LMKGKHOH_02349 [Vibrio sp. B1FIG11]
MGFKTVQTQSHYIDGILVTAEYHRLSTRFTLRIGQELLYSKRLFIVAFKNAPITVNNRSYRVRIIWCLIWRARLTKDDTVVIEELIDKRRSKSLFTLVFSTIMRSLKYVFS